MRAMKFRLLYLAAVLFTGAAQATTVFSQGPPNDNATNIVDFRLADDFFLNQPATITGVSFWYQAQLQDDLASLAYAFYSDLGGAPGSALQSGVVAPVLSSDATAFFAAFPVSPLSLGDGTY